MPKNMLKKRNLILILLCIAVALGACYGYSKYIEKKTFEESRKQLSEVYKQVNLLFSSFVEQNWNLLEECAGYIGGASASDGEDIENYLKDKRSRWGFTDFYFIDENGNYINTEGLRCGIVGSEDMTKLAAEGRRVMGCSMSSEDRNTPRSIFAMSSEPGYYGGMRYTAVGIGYSREAIDGISEGSIYNGAAECYIVCSKGKVLFSIQDVDGNTPEYLYDLKIGGDFKENQWEQLVRGIRKGSGGTIEYKIDREVCYMTYQPVGIDGWSMVASIPSTDVSRNLNKAQWLITSISFAMLSLISLVGFGFLLKQSKKNLDEKVVEIKYREKLFNLLVENTDDIFVLISAKRLKAEYVSHNIGEKLGITAEEVIEDTGVFEKNDILVGKCLNKKRLADIPKGGCLRMEQEYLNKKTGEKKWYAQSIYRASIGREEKLILVISDRTMEIETHKSLESALEIARNASNAKSNFLANMSHDIRTPINAITGMTRIAQRSEGNDKKIRECLEKIDVSSKHLLGLINDILDMSRIESGNMYLNEGKCSLREIGEQTLTMVREQADAKHQTINVDMAELNHVYVIADEMKLNKILLNLLTNSIKYTQAGGVIGFKISELEQTGKSYAKIRFTISDNGMGMSREFLEKIFDPFVRNESVERSKIQGTGLGMPITKAIVEMMGGSIVVDSVEGEGTEVTIEMNLRIARNSSEIKEKEMGNMNGEQDCAGKRFLLAEDFDLNAEIIIDLFEGKGAEVDWAEDGKKAVEMFREKPEGYYDAVFMDVMMPEMNGYEATREIRNTEGYGKTIKIIAMTANAFFEDVKKAEDAGMDEHIAKPIDFDRLESIIANL